MTMSEEALAQVDSALDMIRPEAAEYVTSLDAIRIKTTENNYGNVMGFLSKIEGEMAPLFLIAMVGAGYPLSTAQQLVSVMGWPAMIDTLLTREYLKEVAA